MKKLLYLILLIPIFISAQTLKSFESSDGTEIYYEEFGQGKTLILLSGGPGLNPDYLKELSTTLSKNFSNISDPYLSLILLKEEWSGTLSSKFNLQYQR